VERFSDEIFQKRPGFQRARGLLRLYSGLRVLRPRGRERLQVKRMVAGQSSESGCSDAGLWTATTIDLQCL